MKYITLCFTTKKEHFTIIPTTCTHYGHKTNFFFYITPSSLSLFYLLFSLPISSPFCMIKQNMCHGLNHYSSFTQQKQSWAISDWIINSFHSVIPHAQGEILLCEIGPSKKMIISNCGIVLCTWYADACTCIEY